MKSINEYVKYPLPFKRGDKVKMKESAFTKLHMPKWGIKLGKEYTVKKVDPTYYLIFIDTDNGYELRFHHSHFEIAGDRDESCKSAR